MYRIRVWIAKIQEDRNEPPTIDRVYSGAQFVAQVNEMLSAQGYHVRIDYREKY